MKRWMGAALATAGIALGAAYVMGRATINRHAVDYAEHWRRAATNVPEDAIHYVALGDSAAQGVGASRVETSYVALLAERISQVSRRQVVVTNLSVSMATSRDVVRYQLPQLAELDRAPDILTLDIGGNDVVLPGNTLESFEKHFVDILTQLPPGSFVADVPWFTLPVLSRRAERFNDAVADLIALHGHHRVHIHEATRDLGPLRYHINTAADWFHPNDAGYRAMADLFWGAIEASGRLDLPGFPATGPLG